MGSYNYQKKVTSSTSFRRSFLGRRLSSNLVEMVKNLTFDKKVTETPFFYQNDYMVKNHFALKCFLDG